MGLFCLDFFFNYFFSSFSCFFFLSLLKLEFFLTGNFCYLNSNTTFYDPLNRVIRKIIGRRYTYIMMYSSVSRYIIAKPPGHMHLNSM